MTDSMTTYFVVVGAFCIVACIVLFPFLLFVSARVTKALRIQVRVWQLLVISVISLVTFLGLEVLLEECLLEGLGVPWPVTDLVDLAILSVAGVFLTRFITKADLKGSFKVFVPAAVALTALLVGADLYLNREVELREEIVKLAEIKDVSRPEDNLFEALLGFAHTPKGDILAAGKKVVDEENERRRRRNFFSERDSKEEGLNCKLTEKLGEDLGDWESFRELREEDFPAIGVALEEHRITLDNYRSLGSYHVFENTLLPTPKDGVPINVFLFGRIGKLSRLENAKLFSEGRFVEAARNVRDEIRTWVTVWNSAETFFMRSISKAMLEDLLEQYRRMLDSAAFVESSAMEVEDHGASKNLNLSSEAQLDRLMRCRAVAWVAVNELETELPEDAYFDLFSTGLLFSLDNYTSNWLYDEYVKVQDRVGVPFDDYVELAQLDLPVDVPLGLVLRNPMASLALERDLNFIEGGHMVGGRLACSYRLTRIKELIRKRKTPPTGVEALLKKLPENLGNPFNGEHMKWNPEKRELTCPSSDVVAVDLPIVTVDDLRN